MNLIGKKHSPILMLIKWSIFLIRLISIYNVILFVMACSFMTTDIFLGWTRNSKILFIKKIFNCFLKSNNYNQLLDKLKDLPNQLNFLIEKSKGKHYSQITSKLSENVNSYKTYWFILEIFLNSKKLHVLHLYLNAMKILQILRKKENYSTRLIANRPSSINNNSQLPSSLSYKINEWLSLVNNCKTRSK